MANLYADLGAFQRRVQKGNEFSANDALEAARILGAASRTIEGYTRRRFYPLVETRDFSPRAGLRFIEIPECLAISSLTLDTDADGVYETTLVEGTDFDLINDYDEERGLDAPPFTIVRLLENGAMPVWESAFNSLHQFKILRIAATWGYSQNTETLLTSAGVAVTGTLTDANDLTLATSAVSAYPLYTGVSLKVASEQLYIRGAIATPFVVDRGQNGTTAAAQSAVALSRYVYEPEVVEATLIQCSRLWKRREVPLYPVLAAPGVPDLVLAQGLDLDIQELLTRVKRLRDF
jgi:hypothetical protein